MPDQNSNPRWPAHLQPVADPAETKEIPIVKISSAMPGSSLHEVNSTVQTPRSLATPEQRRIGRRNTYIVRSLWAAGVVGVIAAMAAVGQVGTDPGDVQPTAPSVIPADGSPIPSTAPDLPPEVVHINRGDTLSGVAATVALPGEEAAVQEALTDANGGTTAVGVDDVALYDQDDGHAAVVSEAQLEQLGPQAALDQNYAAQQQGQQPGN